MSQDYNQKTNKYDFGFLHLLRHLSRVSRIAYQWKIIVATHCSQPCAPILRYDHLDHPATFNLVQRWLSGSSVGGIGLEP